MKHRLILIVLVVTAIGLFALPTAAADCTTTGEPEVTTDQPDYGPGDTVHISGTGFECDAELTVRVNAPDGSVAEDPVTADSSGAISTTYQIPDEDAFGEYQLEVLDADSRVLASAVFYDSHFRFGHLNWTETGPSSVEFTLRNGFRRDGYSCVDPLTGDSVDCTDPEDDDPGVGDYFLETIGTTQLEFGDGASTDTLYYRVDTVNRAGNWMLATALEPGTTNPTIPHEYEGEGPWTAEIDSCCRTFEEINNPSESYRVQTLVDLDESGSGSPVSQLPAIVDCPLDQECTFNIPVTDPDGSDTTFRFSTSAESGIIDQPSGATVDSSSGLYTWNTPASTHGDLYSTQVTIEKRGPDEAVIGHSAIDFLIRLVEGNPPVFDVPPTPALGSTLEVEAGNTLSFDVQASDPDEDDVVTIGHLGLPGDAQLDCPGPANPTTCEFTWTPGSGDSGTHGVSFTAQDDADPSLNATPHDLTIEVTEDTAPPPPPPPPPPEDDEEEVLPSEITRLGGADRVETAIEVSGEQFPETGDAEAVFIARNDDYADALAAGPLAYAMDAPILLTPPDELRADVAAEIERLGVDTAYVFGQENAISSEVEDAVGETGSITATDRIGGVDRFATAVDIAEQLNAITGTDATTAYITEGRNPDEFRGWSDAVAVSGLAAGEGEPILLVDDDNLPSPTADGLGDLGIEEAVIIGGSAAVDETVQAGIADEVASVERVFGANRYETSAAVADRALEAGYSADPTWLATGLNWPDTVVGGPAVARSGGVLLLVDGADATASPASVDWLTATAADRSNLYVLGGQEAIADGVLDFLAQQEVAAEEGTE